LIEGKPFVVRLGSNDLDALNSSVISGVSSYRKSNSYQANKFVPKINLNSLKLDEVTESETDSQNGQTPFAASFRSKPTLLFDDVDD
jgi:hypothetical protein